MATKLLYLDRTVFYLQDDGQPYDTGAITAHDWTIAVEKVRYIHDEVLQA